MSPTLGRLPTALRFADAHGLLYETPGRRFLSWADARPCPAFAPGEIWDTMARRDFLPFGYNAIISVYWLWRLLEVADLAAALGAENAARRYRAMFETARPRFDSVFFDHDASLYRDNVAYDQDGVPTSPSFCESTQYSIARAGLVSPATVVSLHRRLRRPGFLCCRTTGGLDLGSVPVALFESGLTAEALDLYRDAWGPPILTGETTCGELFYRSPGNSDCHIHGASPARDLLEYFAGIRLHAPFYREVLLVPPTVEHSVPGFGAVVPTPGGDIEVRYRSRNGRRSYTYRVPRGSQCLLRLPGAREPVHAGIPVRSSCEHNSQLMGRVGHGIP